MESGSTLKVVMTIITIYSPAHLSAIYNWIHH